MSGCSTCGGFGNHHDPIAHDLAEDAAVELRDAIAAVLAEHEPWYQDEYLSGEPPFFTCGRFDPDESRCEWKSDPDDPDPGTEHRRHIADVLLSGPLRHRPQGNR